MILKSILQSTAVALVASVGVAWADDLALIISSGSYNYMSPVEDAGVVNQTVQAFARAGYQTVNISNIQKVDVRHALDSLEAARDNADRIVVVVSGRFLHSGTDTWFAPRDLNGMALSRVAFDALPMSAILAVLGQKPGGAALFLAQGDAGEQGDGTFQEGIGRVQAPQGVMIAQGSPTEVRDAITQHFLRKDVSLADAAERSGALKVRGFVSDQVALNGTTQHAHAVVPDVLEEAAYWKAVDDMGNKAAYQAYLRKYPNGAFATLAKGRIKVIADAKPKITPEEEAEKALNLSRDDRRRVQEQLSLVGFDPKGVDGLFGPGSRSAIQRWQAQNGLAGGGFLDTASLKKLRGQAEKRAAELAAEARREKQARDAADARLWAQTGARGTEADYLAYLSKYPDGLYADTAKLELKRIEQANRQSALAAERQAWDQAVQLNSVAGYKSFLNQYPQGSFSKTAQGKIADIKTSDQDRAVQQQAKAEEAGLEMSSAMMLLVERKLKAIGLKPGKQDGKFNKATREAIATYQKSRGMPATGFVTRQTVVRLMSE